MFLLRHCAVGVAAAGCFLAALIGLDVNGLGTLILNSADPVLAVSMMFFALTITFGSAAMGAGLFLMPQSDDSPPRGAWISAMVPIAAPSRR